MLAKLRAQKVEIHARSLFLKGLILKPNAIASIPQGLITHNEQFYNAMREQNIKTYDACLAFAKKQTEIDRWVIGVSSQQQLIQLLNVETQVAEAVDFEQWAYLDKKALDPRTW